MDVIVIVLTGCSRTHIYVINVENFGLKEKAQSLGLLDGMGQLSVCLRGRTKDETILNI